MISLINKLPEIAVKSVALTRIKCAFSAYGGYPNIALFWEQKNDDGEILALISLLESNLTVFAKEVNDELALFIKSLAPNSVFAEEQTALGLGVKGQKVCVAHAFGNGKTKSGKDIDKDKIYKLFKNDFDLTKDEFIADLSHRLRHTAAFCVLNESGAAVVQTAGESAIITGICVERTHRKTGAGSEILRGIKASFKGNIFVCCEENVLPFYLKNSFEPLGYCVIGRI